MLEFLYPNSRSLAERYYSREPWAVITGTTSGIGEGFVKLLASQGVNLICISRSKDKLEASAKVLRTEYSNVQIVNYAVDLSSLSMGSSDSLKFLDSLVKGRDVVLLVNNAGVSNEYPMLLTEQTATSVREQLGTNVTALTLFAQYFLNYLSARPHVDGCKKGGIINLGSLSDRLSCPYLAVYGASKAYVRSFSLALREEAKDFDVDVFCCTPGWVVSNLSKKTRLSLDTISAEKCARQALKGLLRGKAIGFPHWYHCVQGFVLNMLPRCFLVKKVTEMHKVTREKALKRKMPTNRI